MKALRSAKDPRFLAVTAVLVACALISGMNIGSGGTSAALGPKVVRGFVWDLDWNPLAGANVTVKSWNGAVLADTQYIDATESDGFYEITFGPEKWDAGYTFETTARYGIYTAVNSTTAIEGPFQYLNVTMVLTIPELGDGITAGLTVAGLAAAVVIMSRRRRGA